MAVRRPKGTQLPKFPSLYELNVPFTGAQRSPRQTRTADLYIISVAL